MIDFHDSCEVIVSEEMNGRKKCREFDFFFFFIVVQKERFKLRGNYYHQLCFFFNEGGMIKGKLVYRLLFFIEESIFCAL